MQYLTKCRWRYQLYLLNTQPNVNNAFVSFNVNWAKRESVNYCKIVRPQNMVINCAINDDRLLRSVLKNVQWFVSTYCRVHAYSWLVCFIHEYRTRCCESEITNNSGSCSEFTGALALWTFGALTLTPISEAPYFRTEIYLLMFDNTLLSSDNQYIINVINE